jgi:hypothetical protein
LSVLTRYTVGTPVNRCPLRAAYVGATLSTLLALATAEVAWAHVDVQPRLVEQGQVVQLRVELPRLRPGAAPERIEVEGSGINVLSARLQGVKGSETVWSVRVRITAPPGHVPLILRVVYADGKSVDVKESLTVVPPPAESSFPWAAGAIGIVLALLLAVGLLGLARRRAA